MERDPIGYPDGMNSYEAFTTNPVNRRDPLGLSTIAEQEATIADLQAGLDYDWNAAGGKPGPHNQWLWEKLQEAKAELEELKGEHWTEFEKIAADTVSCEACKKGKEAAEFDCVNKMAVRAGQLAGIEGAGNAVEAGAGVAVAAGGGYAIFYGVTAITGPPGWIVAGVGTIALGVGGYLTYDGLADAAAAADIMNQGRRAAEHLCKCK